MYEHLHTCQLQRELNLCGVLSKHMKYCFQHSQWKLSEGSSMKLINWGLSHLLPHYGITEQEKNSCAHCLTHNLSLGILKPNTGQLPNQLCSAFEISPDHSHVSVFPVNCSVKYWSRVFCEDRHKTMHIGDLMALRFLPVSMNNINVTREDNDFTRHIGGSQGLGEYWINNNMLTQTKRMCPEKFNLVFDKLCISLKISDKDWLGKMTHSQYFNGTYFNAISSYDSARDQICASVNNNKTMAYNDVDLSISLLHIMVDILEEYYPEGSDIYPLKYRYDIYPLKSHYQKYIGNNKHEERYYWLPPPNYPTYIPCFIARERAIRPDVSDVSLFKCEDGSVIADVLVCNGRKDCKNSEDEQQCPMCSSAISDLQSCVCDMFYYQCDGGGCVHYDHMCDSFVDCPGGDDEFYCTDDNKFPYFNKIFLTGSFVTDLCDPPSGDMLMCRTKLQCYNSSAICHYDHSGGVMAYCEDGSHINTGSKCHFIACRQHFKCMMSYCIPTRKICDGIIDCPVGEDEANCEEYICPGHMRCSGVTYCVPPHEICDGISHCPQQDDEKYCQVCPHGCQCKGTGIYCCNVTVHLQNNQLYSPSVLMLHSSYSIFVEFYKHFLRQIKYVWLISLRQGSFVSVLENLENTTQYFQSVKFLYLNYQGLYTLPPYFIDGPNMIYVNLSDNIIQSVQTEAFCFVKNLKILSLVSNKLEFIEAHFFNKLNMLSHLYLSDNPLIHVAAKSFMGNPALVMIRSDLYMVCCVAISTKDCQPQNQFVSSCSDLISSLPQRVAIMAQGIIVVVCNIGTLVTQFTPMHASSGERYLITSLGFADFLMGVYLVVISSVDLIYNRVFHIIVSEWTRSITCIILGLISFVSSEVSLLTLCILAFARMISINKLGGMLLIKGKIKVACVVTWVVIVTSGVACIVCFKTLGIGLRNNMCILLGISPAHQRYITDLENVLQIVLIVTAMLLLFAMIVSMATLFHISVKSYRSVIKIGGKQIKSQKMRLIHIGFKLLLLLNCNVLTWIPILTVSTLLLVGIPVHETILQWVVVLCLPICAITDPILYNLPSIKAYINRNKK